MGTIDNDNDNTGYRIIIPHQYQQCVSESVVKSVHCTHLTAVVSSSLWDFWASGSLGSTFNLLEIAANKCVVSSGPVGLC